MTSTLSTIPAVVEMASTESRPFSLDTSPLLDVGEAPDEDTVSVTLTDLGTGLAYNAGLDGDPIVQDTLIIQTVSGLLAGHAYRLAYTFEIAPGKILTEYVRLECPF